MLPRAYYAHCMQQATCNHYICTTDQSNVNSHDVVSQQAVKLSRHYLAATLTHDTHGKLLYRYHQLPANCNIRITTDYQLLFFELIFRPSVAVLDGRKNDEKVT